MSVCLRERGEEKREEKPNDIRPISRLYYFDVSNMNYKRYMGVIAIAVLY